MKTIKSFALIILALFFAGNLSAQTADEIIAKYLDAIGGKDMLSKITSIHQEGTLSVMGSDGVMKTTTLNGKGMRQDIDIMGATISSCFTDKEGWSINPMAGSTSAEAMPDAQYKAGKDQIFIGGPFINMAQTGDKAELIGKEKVGTADAYKIKVTTPDNISSMYYFDAQTNLLIQSSQDSEMQGQMVTNVMSYSDYKAVDGYTVPYKLDMDIAGGQLTMSIVITKIELNVPVDTKIFDKPL
jgi:hypothetical protein